MQNFYLMPEHKAAILPRTDRAGRDVEHRNKINHSVYFQNKKKVSFDVLSEFTVMLTEVHTTFERDHKLQKHTII